MQRNPGKKPHAVTKKNIFHNNLISETYPRKESKLILTDYPFLQPFIIVLVSKYFRHSHTAFPQMI